MPFVIPRSGQNGFRKFVRRTSQPATISVALSTSVGIRILDVRVTSGTVYQLLRQKRIRPVRTASPPSITKDIAAMTMSTNTITAANSDRPLTARSRACHKLI